MFMIFEKKYSFGKIVISDEDTKDGNIRTLSVNGARESACYTEEGRHFELRFGYTLEFAQIMERADMNRRVLLIGGAGFSVPKYFVSHIHSGTMDVVELHGEMYDIAMQYFFLDELYRKYPRETEKRLRIIIDDGNQYIKNCSKSYDVILDDAYSGRVADSGLLSEGTIGRIADILSPDGVYAINLITPARGFGSMQASLTCSILKNHFRKVSMWQVDPGRKPTERQNCIIMASGPK